MPETLKPYWLITDGKLYYDGTLHFGKPVCDMDRDEAGQFYDDEIADDFPNGLPAGWFKEKPCG